MGDGMLLPSGTVTFLFTDIAGSTRLWEQHPDAMRLALARHDEILRVAIESHDGQVFKTVGDQFCAAFAAAPQALAAALDAQRALGAETWGETGPLLVRVALHAGAAEARGGDYFGPTLNRLARLLAAGHGGQVLLSRAAADAVRPILPADLELRDLGERRLRGLLQPERIFQLVSPDLPSAFPPLNTLDLRPTNLPAPPTSFVGREREVTEVCALLRRTEVRLVTLTGPGGIGKTRLSLQVGAELLDEFEKGVFFVPLAPISDPLLVASTIAQALKVKEMAGEPLVETLKAAVSGIQMLLVLDNFEQVIDAAPLVTELLTAAPRLKILVSSRQWLNVYGEHEYELPPLSLPQEVRLKSVEELMGYEAVALFAERGRAARREFALEARNARVVAAICAQLDGLPLAIELAAARLRVFTPDDLLGRLSDRLGLLTEGPRDLTARQRMLRGSIAWSYDLLTGAERRLLRRLSVFVGGCTLAAAEAVCDAAGDLGLEVAKGLSSLVEKSLGREEPAGDGEARYEMLETIREYGRERLLERGEAEALGERHREFFLRLAEEASPHLSGPEQQPWLERLETEHGNLRAALESLRGAERGGESEARLAGALTWFWYLRGHASEGRTRLGDVFKRKESLTPDLQAMTCYRAAILAHAQSDYAAARRFYEEGLSLFRLLDKEPEVAWTLGNLGAIAMEQGNLDLARVRSEEALALFRKQGSDAGATAVLRILGEVAVCQEEYPAAERHLTESLELYQKLADQSGMAATLSGLGTLFRHKGDLAKAWSFFQQGLTLCRELGLKSRAPIWLDEVAELNRLRGQPERAARLFGAAQGQREALGDRILPVNRREYEKNVARVRASLGEEAFTAAWEEGRAMTLEEAIRVALEE